MLLRFIKTYLFYRERQREHMSAGRARGRESQADLGSLDYALSHNPWDHDPSQIHCKSANLENLTLKHV